MPNTQLIFVMGLTGVGKSFFIKHATGADVPVGETLDPCTEGVGHYNIPGTKVVLVDTPGFDDPNVPDNKILQLISEYLLEAFDNEVEIMGALYVHHITAPRMYRSAMRNLIMFKEVVGMKNMKNVRLVTTKWPGGDMAKKEANERQMADDDDKWRPFLAAGAKMMRFQNTQQSAWEILAPLIQGHACIPQVLAEQVDENKPLQQTKAGVIVTDKVEDVYAACKTEVKELKDVHEQEKGNMTEEFERTLLAETKRAEAALVEARKNRDAWLKLDNKRRKHGQVGRWFARGAAVVGGGLLTLATGGLGGAAALAMYGAVEGGAQAHKGHEDERTRTEGAKYNHL